MSSPESVSALIERLEAGDHEAAQPLWERYYPRLVELARKHLRGTSRRAADCRSSTTAMTSGPSC